MRCKTSKKFLLSGDDDPDLVLLLGKVISGSHLPQTRMRRHHRLDDLLRECGLRLGVRAVTRSRSAGRAGGSLLRCLTPPQDVLGSLLVCACSREL